MLRLRRRPVVDLFFFWIKEAASTQVSALESIHRNYMTPPLREHFAVANPGPRRFSLL